MAVVLETTLGDITIDLYINERPKACLNFLKLCRIKYYNFNLFHTVNQGFIAQTGDPTGSRLGGDSIWGVMEGQSKRYFEAENTPRIKHTTTGLVSFVGDKDSMIGSQFFITLAPDLTYLDAQHCVFGEVTEGFEILRQLNEAICDNDHRPYQDIRITHTVVLEDPFPDPEHLKIPDASPEPTTERLAGGRIAPDEEIDETEGKTVQEVHEIIAEKEAKARATILEMIGDIPDAEMAPPENVLFVCKLNPVTNDDDLEIIFSRFGKIKSCEVIRDKKSGDSLQYAFVEFEEQKSCEEAYFKMDNVLIDDRRIHVDFSQSVAKIKWHGKGRGVTHYNDKGEKQRDDPRNDIGNGRYRKRNNSDSPPRKQDKGDDNFKSREKYEENHSRNRNFDSRKPQRDWRDDRYREEQYRQNQNYGDIERSKRRNENESRYEENRKNQQRSREYQRTSNQDYRRKEQSPSRSKENLKYRHRNISPNRQYRRKYEKSRSRSRDDYRSKYKYTSIEDNNGRRESEVHYKNKKYDENSEEKKKTKKHEESSEEVPKKKKKKRKQESSSEQSSSEDEPVKKSKKKRKKKSKKKSSESDSQSDSEEERKKSKKKKKKSKKYKSSSESTSENDSDVPKNKKRKR